jgi:type I restriction enzyme S subunit
MEEKNNVPELRFPEFSGVWEKHKLGDIEKEGKISLNRGNVIPKGDGPYPVYSSSVKNNGLMGYSNTYMFDRELVSWSIDGGGDFFYRPKHKFSVTNVSGYIDILDDTYLCYKYLAYELQFLHSFLHFDYQTKAHPSVIRELYTIAIPSVAEQEKIGAFISNLDNLIALHQRKLDDTKELKKCLLQKMFPKDGEDTPELRFPGFSVPWEQRKLGDVVGVYDGVHQTPDYTDSGVMFLSVENIASLTSQKYISEEAFERDYKVYPQKGDVLMTRIGDVGTPNVVETTEKVAFYVSLALLKPSGIDSYFLCNLILSPRFKKGLKDRTLVTAIPQKINKDEIGKVDILMPESSAEQEQIGTCFRQLDSLITLHQRKLDDLKALKKCLLQEMFI